MLHSVLESATLYDESYNANPISMSAAIASLENLKAENNKFLILGDMMELGDEEVRYHKELAKDILKAQPSKLILCGSRMRYLWQDIKVDSSFDSVRKEWYPTVNELMKNIYDWLDDNDHIILKASNSIGFDKIIKHIK